MKAGDLEQALLVLPFMDALRLLDHLLAWLAAGLQVSWRSLIWTFLDCLLDCLGLLGQKSNAYAPKRKLCIAEYAPNSLFCGLDLPLQIR